MDEIKKLYRCRPGFTHGAKDEVKPGDIIELTDREAAGLLDKFEWVEPALVSVGGELDSLLPANVVRALAGAGLMTIEAIKAANDETLREIVGIGAKTLELIREKVQ